MFMSHLACCTQPDSSTFLLMQTYFLPSSSIYTKCSAMYIIIKTLWIKVTKLWSCFNESSGPPSLLCLDYRANTMCLNALTIPSCYAQITEPTPCALMHWPFLPLMSSCCRNCCQTLPSAFYPKFDAKSHTHMKQEVKMKFNVILAFVM
jgi:hypothetical protein